MRNTLLILGLLLLPQMAHAECVSYNGAPCVPTPMPVAPVTLHTSNYNYAQMGQDSSQQILNQYNSQVPMFGAQQQQYGAPTNYGYMNQGSQGTWTP